MRERSDRSFCGRRRKASLSNTEATRPSMEVSTGSTQVASNGPPGYSRIAFSNGLLLSADVAADAIHGIPSITRCRPCRAAEAVSTVRYLWCLKLVVEEGRARFVAPEPRFVAIRAMVGHFKGKRSLVPGLAHRAPRMSPMARARRPPARPHAGWRRPRKSRDPRHLTSGGATRSGRTGRPSPAYRWREGSCTAPRRCRST